MVSMLLSLSLVQLGALLFILYAVGVVLYRRYFHTLTKYPGPFWWTVSRLPWVYHQVRGDLIHSINDMHLRYGEVIRTAPDELSFTMPSAWPDIYSPSRTTLFKKDMKVYPRMMEGEHSIFTADNDNHPRHRKLLNHAFGERALRKQEPLIQRYLSQLIEKLNQNLKSNDGGDAVVDMVKYYNWTTFDIVGHLGFGEPFDCLKDEAYHPWVAMLFDHIKGGSYISASRRFPPLDRLFRYLVPKELLAKRKAHLELVREKVNRRIERGSTDSDFLSFILAENKGQTISRVEVELDSALLIIAGSETTATTLSGTTYYLLKSPDALRLLQQEIRSKFASDADIDMLSVQSLPYLNAVLQEGLRLFPPIPMGLARVLEGSLTKGEFVAGHFLPEGTRASVAQWSAYRSPCNFKDPNAFRPERWLAGHPEFAGDRKDVVQSFSMGPRNCIGIALGWAELRLILSRIIWSFDLDLLDDGFNPKHMYAWNLWAKPALNLRLRSAHQGTDKR